MQHPSTLLRSQIGALRLIQYGTNRLLRTCFYHAVYCRRWVIQSFSGIPPFLMYHFIVAVELAAAHKELHGPSRYALSADRNESFQPVVFRSPGPICHGVPQADSVDPVGRIQQLNVST